MSRHLALEWIKHGVAKLVEVLQFLSTNHLPLNVPLAQTALKVLPLQSPLQSPLDDYGSMPLQPFLCTITPRHVKLRLLLLLAENCLVGSRSEVLCRCPRLRFTSYLLIFSLYTRSKDPSTFIAIVSTVRFTSI